MIDFGFSEEIIQDWERGGNCKARLGSAFDSCLVSVAPTMQKIGPNGFGRIGLYLDSIRAHLRANFPQGGTILDFGCGPWPDISAVLAKDGSFSVQLMDVIPLSLAFSSYLLAKRGIRHEITLAKEGEDELEQIAFDLVMIVESSAFEHVPHIRYLLEPLLRKLPPGGLFLTNYTRVDWSQSCRDGFEECHRFAEQAVGIAAGLACRHEWSPPQPGGRGDWDLWEIL